MKTVSVEVTIDPKNLRDSLMYLNKELEYANLDGEPWWDIYEIVHEVIEQGWDQ